MSGCQIDLLRKGLQIVFLIYKFLSNLEKFLVYFIKSMRVILLY